MTLANNTAPLGPLDGFHDFGDGGDGFLEAVVAGLSQPRKTLPCKYFYDARGSRLFDAICTLKEYYPTRTETGLLHDRCGEIAALAGPGVNLVEFGSGSSTKVRIVLDALDRPAAYVPVDISRDHLLASARLLAADYPALAVIPVCADYTAHFDLPERALAGPRLGFFPGSTIGNFTPDAAVAFLAQAAGSLGAGAGLLIGADLKKDVRILHAAYDDARGVTAAFNMNLLVRINRELGGNFDLDAFAHEARWNPADGRIEMHLVSRRRQAITVRGDITVDTTEGVGTTFTVILPAPPSDQDSSR